MRKGTRTLPVDCPVHGEGVPGYINSRTNTSSPGNCVACRTAYEFAVTTAKKAEIVLAMGGQCYRCEETRLAALTLHHRDPATRSRGRDKGQSKLWGSGKLTASVWAEVWLCDLLCHSCHNVHHATILGDIDVWSYLR